MNINLTKPTDIIAAATTAAADTRPEWAKTRVSAQIWPLVQAASRALREGQRARNARARKTALVKYCAARAALDAARGITPDPFLGAPSDGAGDCVKFGARP